jgi:hypothetical protein
MARTVLSLACWAFLAACKAPALPSIDACAVEIVRLESLRSQEVLGACEGRTFDECAPVIERIDEKYAPFILEQIRCGSAE